MKKIMMIIVALLVGTIGASAMSITLDPGLLPSSQGWGYHADGVHSGTLEGDVFSTDGSVLAMNTMGLSLSSTGAGIVYRQFNVVDSNMPTTLEWTSRTLEYEQISGGDLGFSAGFSDGSLKYQVGISLDRISLIDGAGVEYISMDTTEYHTYRIETVTGTSAYNFYIDDVLQSSALAGSANTANFLYFGDATSLANARADITSLEFIQIPEPSVIALMGIFGAGIVSVRRLFPAV